MTKQIIALEVNNNATILTRVIRVIRRRRINIDRLLAEDRDATNSYIEINISSSDEQARLIKNQLEKLVDVIAVA